jgi:hypothetical protein
MAPRVCFHSAECHCPPWAVLGTLLGSISLLRHPRWSSRPRRSMCNLLPRSNQPPRRLASLLLLPLSGTIARIPRVTTRMYNSAPGGWQPGSPDPAIAIGHAPGMPYGGPAYSARESISAAGGQPLEAGGGGRPWRRWGRGRPGHWGGGYARHLIPFGIHTLDIRHVIPGLRSRCRRRYLPPSRPHLPGRDHFQLQ